MASTFSLNTNFLSEDAHNNLQALIERYARKSSFNPLEDFACDTSQFLVSVIIPTHNRKEMLKEAVDSVLMQINCRTEIIIVDDASTDDTAAFVHDEYADMNNVRYIRNETSLGPGKARQKGYLNASGDYIVFLDDDDLYIDPTFFEKALKCHAYFKTCTFVCGNTVYFYQNTCTVKQHSLNHIGFIRGEDYFMGFSTEYKKPLSSFPSIFKRSVLDAVGFENMEMMNDASIYLRALCLGDVFILEDYIGAYRVHGNNISKGIDLKFLMENIDEKYSIYLFSKEHGRTQNITWLKTQVNISVRYYLAGDKSNIKDFCPLIKWCCKHPDYKMIWMIKEILRSMIRATKKTILGPQ